MSNVVGWSVRDLHEAFHPPGVVSRRFLAKAVKDGLITTRRLGSARIVTARDLQDFIDSQPVYTKAKWKPKAGRFTDPDNEENVDG